MKNEHRRGLVGPRLRGDSLRQVVSSGDQCWRSARRSDPPCHSAISRASVRIFIRTFIAWGVESQKRFCAEAHEDKQEVLREESLKLLPQFLDAVEPRASTCLEDLEYTLDRVVIRPWSQDLLKCLADPGTSLDPYHKTPGSHRLSGLC